MKKETQQALEHLARRWLRMVDLHIDLGRLDSLLTVGRELYIRRNLPYAMANAEDVDP